MISSRGREKEEVEQAAKFSSALHVTTYWFELF